MKYELILGLEVHIQSKTKSKMFCGCSTDYFGDDPNTHTCPVCLGLPGALPVPNEKAVRLCAKLGLALNCKISKETKFDRKNYFYTDLPKGYQISQYDQPIAYEGYIDIDADGETKRIGITRVHQEEDTGKSVYVGDETHLDFNKSGVPLIEVVTEPDFRSVEEVLAFARDLRQLVRFLGVSDADMEKGQMRFEPNMSLRKLGEKELPPYKVEVKNIGSISILEQVIKGEYERQAELLDKGETPVQETRGLKDTTGETFSQRQKESEADYRYFPEPDIPPITFTEKDIEDIRSTLPKMLPQDLIAHYTDKLGMTSKDARYFVESPGVPWLFGEVIKGKETDKTFIEATIKLIKTLLAVIAEEGVSIDFTEIKPNFVKQLIENPPASHLIKDLLKVKVTSYWSEDISLEEILKKEGLESVSDEDQLSKAAEKAIEDNPKAVEDYRNNPNAIMYLVGQVMKEMKGKSDPNVVRKILEAKLK